MNLFTIFVLKTWLLISPSFKKLYKLCKSETDSTKFILEHFSSPFIVYKPRELFLNTLSAETAQVENFYCVFSEKIEDCTVLTHQHLTRIKAFICSLARGLYVTSLKSSYFTSSIIATVF